MNASLRSFTPIGILRSPFKEKFGIPRQSGLTQSAEGVIHLGPNPDFKHAVQGLEKFSHLWLIFVFHEHGAKNWKPSIRPPRLGGAKKVGVLASRSPHRPNPIGLSAVELKEIKVDETGIKIHVLGVDLLDQTPILDIKPYLPYADSIPTATAGWAEEPIERMPVTFSDRAEKRMEKLEGTGAYGAQGSFRKLITEVIGLDPRPGFQKRKNPAGDATSVGQKYGMWILDQDVKWQITDAGFLITDLVGEGVENAKGASR